MKKYLAFAAAILHMSLMLASCGATDTAPEEITSEKAGEVYYSEPNRIVLFCHDAEISGEYTLAGKFDVTDTFIQAVENNPVLEGWGNKIVTISPN